MNRKQIVSDSSTESGLRPFKYFVVCSIFVGIIIGFLFYNFNYIENLGFHNGDDGVLLSQSFRILHGAIPHKDFISIKPVFSSILHAVHFYMPFPLEVVSRWGVLFEYFIFSFTWIYLLFKIFNLRIWKRNRYIIYSISAAIFTFILNITNPFYFPTPAIDATLFAILSLLFFISKFQETYLIRKTVLMTFAIFFIICAALCQQSFAIPALVLCIYIIYKSIKTQNYIMYFLTIIFGLIPFWIYLIWIVKNNAFTDFKHQIINRHEMFQSGIVIFLNSFVYAKLLVLHVFVLATLTFIYLKNKRWLFQNNKPLSLTVFQKRIVAGVLLFYCLCGIIISFIYIIGKNGMNNSLSFELFWAFVILSCIVYFIVKLKLMQRILIISAILIAWSGSATMHLNAPLFTIGLMTSGILIISSFALMNLFSVRNVNSILINRILPFTLILFSIVFVVIFLNKKLNFGKSVQSNVEITVISDEFGQIKMNPNAVNYFQEIAEIFRSYPGVKNNFVVIPDNPLVYPIFNSINPFPAEDLLPFEYIRFRTVIVLKMEKIIDANSVYLIIDKQYSKEIMENMNTNAYNVLQYFKEIQSRFVNIPLKSKRLMMYKSL